MHGTRKVDHNSVSSLWFFLYTLQDTLQHAVFHQPESRVIIVVSDGNLDEYVSVFELREWYNQLHETEYSLH